MRAAIADQHHVAVRLRLGDTQTAGHARRRSNVFDDDRLAKPFAHALRLNARADIDAAVGREWHDQIHSAAWPVLGVDWRRDR